MQIVHEVITSCAICINNTTLSSTVILNLRFQIKDNSHHIYKYRPFSLLC